MHIFIPLVGQVKYLLYFLFRNLPPCLKAPEIATQHSEEIKRQLLNATEPLVSTLIGNRRFIEYLTLSDQGKILLKKLPTNKVEPVLSGHSKRRSKLVFKIDYCLMQVKSIAECCNNFDHHYATICH